MDSKIPVIRVSKELRKFLEAEAERRRRKLSDTVRVILEEYKDRKEKE